MVFMLRSLLSVFVSAVIRWDGYSDDERHRRGADGRAASYKYISPRVKQAQLSGGAFAGILVEVPMGDAAVHELREADNIGAHPQTALKKVSEIDRADGRQTALFEQGNDQPPKQ
jgi:hypothetical protein